MSAGELAELIEESAEDLYERAPVGYMSSLVDGTIVKVNETLLSWTGHARDELVSKQRIHDLLAPGARIYYETHVAPLLLMQGEIREIAVELVRADGTRMPALLNARTVLDEAGRPLIIRTTVFEASDRRRYERELLRARAEAEQRARAAIALGHVHDGVVLVDYDGRVEVMNTAAERILGVDGHETLGRSAAEVLEGWAELATAVKPVGGPADGRRSVVPVQRHGHDRWLSVAAVDAGDGTVYTISDVTGDRNLDQVRNELIAIVSHELRTPLTGVYGAALTLVSREDSLPPETRRALLEMIVQQSRRLTSIVESVLMASQLDNDAIAPEIDAFDAAEVLDGLVQVVADDQRHRVIIEAAPKLVVRADLDRLRQVMANLIDNGLKYSSGDVRVGIGRHGHVVRFVVADDGPGIPPGDADRIFEKFYRLDPDQKSGVSGTGLGLYIARELVSRMGGTIGLLLPRERGTAFYVDLPQAERDTSVRE